MCFGFTVTAIALFYMSTHLVLNMDFKTAAMLRVYQTLGLAFIFIPTNTLCYVGIPREKNNQVSSMINFVRNIGGSIGIALISAFVTRTAQIRQSYLSANTQNGNPKFRQMVDGLAATLQTQGLDPVQAMRQAYARMGAMLEQQATALAYKDVVSVLAIIIAFLIPMAFIMKRPPASGGPAPPMH
jgi:DHA2 family multidrug resistance protein